jgi:glycosyltransferase involved in cell wall biosynthesis
MSRQHRRLRISIYNDPAGSGIGGSEFVAALLAEAFAQDHEVDLFHRVPSLTVEKLAANSGTNLNGVELHYVGAENPANLSRRNPLSNYRESRNALAKLSDGYDIFVAIVHNIPPFCHAKRGALIVLFPASSAPYVKPLGGVAVKPAMKHPGRYVYQSWAWARRMETYQVKTAISDFSRRWTQKLWGVDCQIVYPPVDTSFGRQEKQKLILSVGRFAIEGDGHTKKQEQMLLAFQRMKETVLSDWDYASVGGLQDTPGHKAYFAELSRLAVASGARVVANMDRPALRDLYERSSIFWHAAGYGEDENKQPVSAEHFGISTVEAMAAGCVPVVIKKGGQKEIVEHGVSGFLWETLEELQSYTERLVTDDSLRAQMSEAARKRAQVFSRDSFVESFLGRLFSSPTTGKQNDSANGSGE